MNIGRPRKPSILCGHILSASTFLYLVCCYIKTIFLTIYIQLFIHRDFGGWWKYDGPKDVWEESVFEVAGELVGRQPRILRFVPHVIIDSGGLH